MRSSLDYYEYSADRTYEVFCLKQLSNILTENNIIHWIDFGTLLGSIRNNSIIDWDVDLDISCIINPNDSWWKQTQINLLWKTQEKCYIKYFWKDNFIYLLPR